MYSIPNRVNLQYKNEHITQHRPKCQRDERNKQHVKLSEMCEIEETESHERQSKKTIQQNNEEYRNNSVARKKIDENLHAHILWWKRCT